MPIALLPRRLQLPLVAWVNSWWIKSAQLDFHLLTVRQMQEVVPDATIRIERFLGIPKSLIAVQAG